MQGGFITGRPAGPISVLLSRHPSPGRRLLRAGRLVALAGLIAGAAAPTASAVSGSVGFSAYDARPAVPTGITTTIRVDSDPSDPGASQLRRLQVTLPQGVDLGPQMSTAGGGLRTCSPAAFAVHAAVAASCPAESTIGTSEIVAPTIGTLTGIVYLGQQPAVGELPGVYLEASLGGTTAPEGPRVKLAGSLSVDGDGRLSIVFDEIPTPAFTQLRLSLAGGGGPALLGTPSACGTYAGFATLTSAFTGATAATAAPITIDQDCALPGFDPSAAVAAASPQAAASTPTVLVVNRPDRSPAIGSARLSLPSGLLAQIGSAPECGLSGASTASCPADTRIATAEVVAGLGDAARTFRGPVYLTGRESGAVAGAVAVIRGQIGDVDLGDVIIPVRIDLRAADAGVDISFAVPSRFRGVTLSTRQILVNIDRPGFMQNPSSCGPLGYSSVINGTGGESVTRTASIGYSGCAALNFAPTLQATLTGDVAPLGHPNVSVALNARDGDANLRSATVTLPRGVAADLNNIKNVCPREIFEIAACSASQRVGTATARISLTPEPIPGDVYLVRIPGQTLPGLGLSFTGRYAQRVISTVFVNGEGRLVARFDWIPDLPLRRLDMTITGGRSGPIQLSKEPCRDGAVWDASFAGHGGQASSHTIPAPCAPHEARKSAITLSSISGLRWRIADLGGRTLQSAKLTLPGTFTFVRKRARLKQYQVVQLSTGKGKLAVTSKAVVLSPQTKTARSLSVKLKPGSVGRTGKIKVNSRSPLRRVSVKVRLGFTDGTVQNQTIVVRAR